MSLEQAFRQVLAEMSLIQYGKSASYNSSGGRSENPDPRPQGASWTLADHWAAEWAKADGDFDRLSEVYRAARDELQAWKRREAPAEGDDSTLEDWVLQDGEGYAVAQVAGKFGIAEGRVRRIRLKAGRESEYGLVVDPASERDRSEERVIYLRDRGCSWREIAAQTGLHKTQVQRILARQRDVA
jgi:hypothetical protein